jgi:hypothetical protein
MKNIITIGTLTHVIFNPNNCTFAQSNKQEKAPLLPEIAHKKPKKAVMKISPFQLPTMEYALNREGTQKKRYNRKSNKSKFF